MQYFYSDRKEIQRKPIDIQLPIGINILGYLRGEFGLGTAARILVNVIQNTKFPYVLNNFIASTQSNRDKTFQSFSLKNPYRINLININAHEFPRVSFSMGKSYFRGRYNIGVWFWEWPNIPDHYLNSMHRLHEIWVATKFTQEAFLKVSPIPVIKITYPIQINTDDLYSDRPLFGLNEEDYIFLFSFDFQGVVSRKNPVALIQSFNKAFTITDKVSLVLKMKSTNLNKRIYNKIVALSRGANIKIINENISGADMMTLNYTADCYVSLHRSEGLGLGMANSMYLGKPVIGTGYSGNMDFMNSNNSYLVDYSILKIADDDNPFIKGSLWAEPDINHAAELMRYVFDHQDESKAMGIKAAIYMRQEYNLDVAAKLLSERISAIVNS